MTYEQITHGLWADTAPDKPELKTFSGEKQTEVAIIGAGYTGLSAALHLAMDGISCTVLEAKDVGFGGAGRNVGLVNAGLWLLPEDVIAEVGKYYGDTLIRELGASPQLVYSLVEKYGMDCQAWPYGTLHCADSRAGLKDLKKREEQWKTIGAPVRLLDRDEAAEKLGSKAYRGALLDERAGTIQPLAYAFGLANAALKEGAELYNNSPVIDFDKTASGYTLKTPNGQLKAQKVIIAVMGYPERAFADQMKNLVPFNYFQFATAPIPQPILDTVLPDKNGIWDTNLILSSFRLDQEGRLSVGSVGNLNGFAMGVNKTWAMRTLNKVFPQIGDIELDYAWYGRIAMTTNHIPRFHVLDDDLAMVTCYNGRGIGPGTVFGKLMAKYMNGGSPADIPLPVLPMRAVNVRRLRGLFYEAGSRLYHYAQRRTPIF